jgi:hypothetical protein
MPKIVQYTCDRCGAVRKNGKLWFRFASAPFSEAALWQL